MKKILYIAPENTVGTLGLWKKYHEEQGNYCRYITFYPSSAGYPEDICLHLPFITTHSFYQTIRYQLQKLWYKRDPQSEKSGYPPVWIPANFLEKLWFTFRDWLWSFKVEKLIKQENLLDFDIYHFEWGLDFYRHSGFAKRIHQLGKPIICTYHGQDMRNRGVLPDMDKLASLNLSSELDLLSLHPNLQYLFLPFETNKYKINNILHSPIRICHSTTNRYFKGSEHIISIVKKLEKEENVEFVLIENLSHAEAMELKQSCDINIDQLTDLGGWGYGMNSVESLSMGICTVAFLNEKYEAFIPDHPFVNTRPETLYSNLKSLIKTPENILKKKKDSVRWVQKYHDLDSTGKQLYRYYKQLDLDISTHD